MTIKIIRNVLHWSAALMSVAALVVVIANAAEDVPSHADPPAGALLIASAEIRDPRFHHSVVLLLRNDSTGAFGIVINNPLGERPLAALLSETDGRDGKDSKGSTVEGTIRVFFGGHGARASSKARS